MEKSQITKVERGEQFSTKVFSLRKVIIYFAPLFLLMACIPILDRCTNTVPKIQGHWDLAIIYDGKTEGHFDVEFIGDSVQIITDPYYKTIEKLQIKIIGDKWLRFMPWKNAYDTIATIELLSNTKIVLNIIDEYDKEHVVKHEFNKIAPKQDFSKEKEISPKKYEKKIIGEWEFTERQDRYGEWKNYGEPVGWHMVFAKDGNGYQVRDDKLCAFQWVIVTNGNKVFLTDSKYPDSFFVIKRMTNNTMQILAEDEEYKLIRQR